MIIRIIEKETDRIITEIRTDEGQLTSLLSMLEEQYDPHLYLIEFNELKNSDDGNLKDGLHSIIPVISVFIIPFANILLLLSVFIIHDLKWKAAGIICSVLLLVLAVILLRRGR